MRIVIEDIDSASMRLMGYSPKPSFLAHFRSAAFSGTARLVPAVDNPAECVGMNMDVEITQDSVTHFRVVDHAEMSSVETLENPGSFKVTGLLHSQSTCSDPEAQSHAFIIAGEACFCLSQDEMGGLWPDPDNMVTFIAHDVSLWDEAL